MKILIACEESQAVCIEFRKKGHEAYSCDLQECSGGHPEWHIQDDALKIIGGGGQFKMLIGFPPCTHIATCGAKHFEEKRKDGRQENAINFFMELVNAPIEKIAIENPVGIMSSVYRKPDQIIQPFYFGDEYQKTTCLWLKGLPRLVHAKTNNLFEQQTHVSSGEFVTFKSGKKHPKWYADAIALPKEERSKIRSRTFPGIAKAMAEQWG